MNVQGVIFDTISYSSSVFKDDDFDFINSYSGHKSEKKKRSNEALRKWSETLFHVLDPSSLCIYVGNERLTAYVNTRVARLHSRDAPEFKADAVSLKMHHRSRTFSSLFVLVHPNLRKKCPRWQLLVV
jgi:hypothetical protein